MNKTTINKEKLFGTDGIRGTPGIYPLTDDMLVKISSGVARYVHLKKDHKKKLSVTIGKDTRLSGEKIESLIADSLSKRGINVILIGTITTPGLSFFTKELKADIGIMISASHNKASDNGIKFFNSKGHKLSTKEEDDLEKVVFDAITHEAGNHYSKTKGKITSLKNAQSKYVDFLVSTVKGIDLTGMRIALDCACGAAAPFGKKLFSSLGAEVFSINDTPQGDAINIGGAINPLFLKELVTKTKADIGIAVDGDGDRGILVDEIGCISDGDFILAILARYLMKKKKLAANTVVGTVMTNYGLRVFLERIGAKIITANVGDKYVLEELLKNNLTLGGEQSGHIIFLEHLATPDGLLTALQMLQVMKDEGLSLSSLCSCMTKYPQILVNIKVKEKRPFEEIPLLTEKLKKCNESLKEEGRILLRYSGTENLARVMVEGKDKVLIETIAHSLADNIKQCIGI